ncbi:hypothetical protein [Nocardioides sp. SYSU DS0651]|uniref:hypothetical protein n=1 Tax=Nocardioides sp. SYSU DS0651 TaxID=3415955 RepID=UPI003F4BA6F1
MAQWVPVLVRLEDYDEITRLVARWEAERSPDVQGQIDVNVTPYARPLSGGGEDAPSPDENSGLAGRPSWSVEDLRRLSASSALTAQRWTMALDVCVKAREAGEIWLPTSEVAARAGMTVNEWRDAPRKFPRHLATNYPGVPANSRGQHYWPLVAGGDHIPNNGGQVWWAVTAETAERWREVRGEALA